MSVEQILGYAQYVLDVFGIGNILPVILTISVAGMAIGIFLRRRD